MTLSELRQNRYIELPESERDRYRETLFVLDKLHEQNSRRHSTIVKAEYALVAGDYGPADELIKATDG